MYVCMYLGDWYEQQACSYTNTHTNKYSDSGEKNTIFLCYTKVNKTLHDKPTPAAGGGRCGGIEKVKESNADREMH